MSVPPPATPARHPGPRKLDAITSFLGLRWDSPEVVRLQIRPELLNGGGLLSGVATFALVDYSMGSALWVNTADDELIATVNIAINYIKTAVEGEIVCTTTLDRRNRTSATLRSEIRHTDGTLMVTALGTYTIFARRRAREAAAEGHGAGA